MGIISLAVCRQIYGPNDNFNLDSSHVYPALMRKFYEAKLQGIQTTVEIWGTGSPLRSFCMLMIWQMRVSFY